MKAITVKIVPETMTKPTRLKVDCEGMKTEWYPSSSWTAHEAANDFANSKGFLKECRKTYSQRMLVCADIVTGKTITKVFTIVNVPAHAAVDFRAINKVE